MISDFFGTQVYHFRLELVGSLTTLKLARMSRLRYTKELYRGFVSVFSIKA